MSKITINTDSLKSRREWKRHKVKDGNNIFRILPPFGENSNGYPYRKWQIIWGLKNPEDGRMRPYASSLTSEKRCPVAEYTKELKDKYEVLKAKLQAAGKSEDDIKEQLGALQKLAMDLSPKTVYIYNAVDKSGEIGLLELKSTAHKKMKAEMLDYIQVYNQDPTSLNGEDDDSGVWFNVTRSGLGRDTTYDVKKCQNRVKNPTTGKLSFEDDRSPLPDNVVSNFSSSAYDLSSVYQIKSYDELAEILEANMADLIDLCPHADLSGAVQAPAPQAKTAPAAVKPSAKVALKIQDDTDDEEDEEEIAPTPRKASLPTRAKNLENDDFLAQAESLLNS